MAASEADHVSGRAGNRYDLALYEKLCQLLLRNAGRFPTTQVTPRKFRWPSFQVQRYEFSRQAWGSQVFLCIGPGTEDVSR